MATSTTRRISETLPAIFLAIAIVLLPGGQGSLASDSTMELPGESVESSEPAENMEPANVGDGADSSQTIDPTNEQMDEDINEGPVCHGVLTCSLYVVGKLIAVPFCLLGGVFDFLI